MFNRPQEPPILRGPLKEIPRRVYMRNLSWITACNDTTDVRQSYRVWSNIEDSTCIRRSRRYVFIADRSLLSGFVTPRERRLCLERRLRGRCGESDRLRGEIESIIPERHLKRQLRSTSLKLTITKLRDSFSVYDIVYIVYSCICFIMLMFHNKCLKRIIKYKIRKGLQN